MTLAVLLLISVSFLQATPQADAAQQPAATPPNPSAQKSQSQTPAKPHTTSKRTRKKKALPPDCNASATYPSASTVSKTPSSSSPSPTGSDSNDPVATSAPKNCPPPKIIVRHGGTSEPSIQLAGGPSADEAARKKDAINQLLGRTDENLKKSTGRQLTSVQQDSVTQMRQFMEESKKAMADGDLERARTLAWKAEVLSEDLVNPEK